MVLTGRNDQAAFCVGDSTIDAVRPLYFLPADDLKREALIPAFKWAGTARCMTGFFSSSILIEIAPGLASYIASSSEPFRLIVSPFLSLEDLEAIESGFRSRDDLAEEWLTQLFFTEDRIARHAVECLSYLLRNRRLDLKIAFMRNGLFHPKVWLFENSGSILAAHGSSNATHSGLHRNYEQVTVSKSWQDPNQRYVAEKLRFMFDRLWEDKEEDCVVIDAPEALRRSLLQAQTGPPPSEEHLLELYRRAASTSQAPEPHVEDAELGEYSAPCFNIPSHLRYAEGEYSHQGDAVEAWRDAGYRGVLDMATGSGKTITSMIAAYHLLQEVGSLLIVVAAPYVPLVVQWCGEIELFGLRPTNLTLVSGYARRARAMSTIRRRIRLGLSNVEAVVVSHDTLCTPEFIATVEKFDCPRLLIGDEAHNLGSQGFISLSPQCFDHRLALSATPTRQFDPGGTEALYAYFGPVVFSYPIESAIGKCLVEYDYHVHPVRLTDDEMAEWRAISHDIRQNAWRAEEGTSDNYLNTLFRERRILLEMAHNKIEMLGTLLDSQGPESLKYTLIYASDKGPSQLEQVNAILNCRGVLFHQLTASETADRRKTARILKSFQSGEIRVLTAKRVLDEGVNIPQICKAYVLASTTVGRQWIQRRGRLLRICKPIGKTSSEIHDFIALPPLDEGPLDRDARALIRSELRRVMEFARMARNAGRSDGPMAIIQELVDAAFLDQGEGQWQ